jgi:hypothetical protein
MTKASSWIVSALFSIGLVACGSQEGSRSIGLADSDQDGITTVLDAIDQGLLAASDDAEIQAMRRKDKPPEPVFLRGDVNVDKTIDKSDGPLFTQAVKNASGHACPAALDVNLDGRVNQDDVGAFHSGLNEFLSGGALPWADRLIIRKRDCLKVIL